MANTSPQASNKRGMLVMAASVVAMTLVIFAAPTVIILLFGMLPTFVAFVIDREPERYATFCVASMNFCGVFPYMMDLWLHSHTVIAAFNSLTNVFTLVVIFGAAGFGWVIYSSVPTVISSFILVVTQRRVASLRSDQRKLIEEWGEGVAVQVEGAVERLKELAEKAKQAKLAGPASKVTATPGPPTAPGAPAPPSAPDTPHPPVESAVPNQNSGQQKVPDNSAPAPQAPPVAGQPPKPAV